MNYIKEANSTLSNKFHGNLIAEAVFLSALAEAIEALRTLDVMKKTLFYGKALPEDLQLNTSIYENCYGLPEAFKTRTFGENIIHGILGVATESGELLEALHHTLVNQKDFDEVNLKEEIGDCFWYNAVLCEAIGTTFEEIQAVNIAKLRKRFPDKFNEFDAVNRDLKAERKILEA